MEEIKRNLNFPVLVLETEHLDLDTILKEGEILKQFKICYDQDDIEIAKKAMDRPQITYNFHFMQVAKRLTKIANQ